ncbi:ABC transporter ATP-binding protein [Nocardioides immobilis]|uniref:ABC transporter ATP-binding protein n=1 Tax=Nocardioides immobilis TaxID=2049295 RepID=A0A417XUL2_9ACTN|nr:ABC transporter ATP-binding protein [Nocardioides immobilis]RHW23985.1 ABC transporter ATP-binding protein [Nocardioides immobilis]
MSDLALRLESVTGGYGDTTVIRDVSLEVPRGAVIALLGPNGAGKTTLLKMVSGVLTPASGRIFRGDEDITAARIHRRSARGLCHIPDGHGIFPSLTVKENLVLSSPKGQERASIEKATSAFPALGQRLGQTAGSMSGGQQQMLAVVRSYLKSPDLILIDEVSMGLAPVVVDEIFAFISDLSAQGTSMLLVEQYVARVLAIASHVYMLNQGSITLSCSAEELRRSDLFDHYLSTGGAPADVPARTGDR